jgi:hypothetical protein
VSIVVTVPRKKDIKTVRRHIRSIRRTIEKLEKIATKPCPLLLRWIRNQCVASWLNTNEQELHPWHVVQPKERAELEAQVS